MVDVHLVDVFVVVQVFVLRVLRTDVLAPFVPAPATPVRLRLSYDRSNRDDAVYLLDEVLAVFKDLFVVVAYTVLVGV